METVMKHLEEVRCAEGVSTGSKETIEKVCILFTLLYLLNNTTPAVPIYTFTLRTYVPSPSFLQVINVLNKYDGEELLVPDFEGGLGDVDAETSQWLNATVRF
jgi:hypothetical protein